MILRLHKKHPTTAPMVRREILVDSVLRRLLAGPAFRSLAIGLALVSTASAQQPSEAERYAPPVHVQPAAFSVIESPADQAGFERSAPPSFPRMAPPAPTGPVPHGVEIANMSKYMRLQNEAALAAKDAQVVAALHQLQRSPAVTKQVDAFPRSTPPRQQYNYPAPVRPPAPPTRMAQRTSAPVARVAAARNPVARNTAARNPVAAPQPVRQVRVANQSIQIERPSKKVASSVRRSTQTRRVAQTQQRRPVGLQDRISQAFRKTFTREQQQQQQVATRRAAQPIPTQANPVEAQPLQLVQHTNEGTGVVVQPRLAIVPAEVQPVLARSKPQRIPSPQREYRPTNAAAEKVIVPSFIEPDSDMTPTLQLTSKQEPIGSGLRRPQIESRSLPLSYGGEANEISIFRNTSAQDSSSDDPEISDRLKQMDEEFGSSRDEGSDSRLPARPMEDRSSLDLEDKDTEDEAMRLRKEIDAELDDLEDEREEILNDDVFNEDEDDDDLDDDDGPPVYDERGCDELRELLLGRSIRDVSLDISPPASARRYEIGSISRSWSDASGNVIGNGTMVDIRRGYVILDTGIKLPYAKLSESDHAAIAENWLLPSGCSIGSRGELGRHWTPQTVTWHASSLCHKPLYFENVQLERYGHSRGPFAQPIHSTFHFFGSLLFLPYNTAIHPPNECRSSLGYYRPGSCAPWLLDPIPFSRDGIRRQALAATGIGFFP